MEKIPTEITIKLTLEQYYQLEKELGSLYSYHWGDDGIHANDCGSKVLSDIQDQGREQGAC